MPGDPPQAVVLLSGGLDSATVLAIARADRQVCHALSFRYGQRHEQELAAARRVADALGAASHTVIPIGLGRLGGLALTDLDIAVPEGRSAEDMAAGIPVTYVPARNTVFLAYALAVAEVTGAGRVYIGVNSMDYSGYPDCRPEFIAAFQEVARLATRQAVEGRGPEIVAPLQHMAKADIIRRGIGLGVDYALTLSCYNPDAESRACGRCDSCQLRHRGFAEAGVPDPTPYQPGRTPGI